MKLVSDFAKGGSPLMFRRNFFKKKNCQVLEQAAQKSDAVTIPRGIEKVWHLGRLAQLSSVRLKY